MAVAIQAAPSSEQTNSGAQKLPANVMLFLAYALALSQDTQTGARKANQALTVIVADIQMDMYKRIYEQGTASALGPNPDNGLLVYDAKMVAYLTEVFKEAAKNAKENPSDKDLGNKATQAAARLIEAQAKYHADSAHVNATTGSAGTLLQQLKTGVRNDDNNLARMTKEVQVMMTLMDFTKSLITSYKK